MKLRNKLSSALTLAKIRYLNHRIPLAIRWQLTNRCPSRCLYCNLWQMPSPELTTEQTFSILDELEGIGTKTISYSGGEPMLREDLGKIIDYTVGKGISTSVNTNGFQVTERLAELRNLDLMKISLDGPPEFDNRVRGHREAYNWAISAAEAAKKHKIKFTFCTTLTRYNLTSIEFMVNLARRYETMVAFQPLKTIYRGVEDMSDLYPTKEEWSEAMRNLRELKRTYPENIRNSELLLDHIENWPRYGKFRCWAGKVFCIIDVNGNVVPCDRVDYPTENIPNALELGFAEAFRRLPEARCSGCGFCGAMELNFLLEGKLEILPELKRLLRE